MKPIEIKLGTLYLIVSNSVTANIFHIVDQISEWSVYCHKQYSKYFRDMGGLSHNDLEMLQKHKELRKKRGWGGCLEQTFYTNLILDEALKEGIKSGYISEEEATIEKEILTNFTTRIKKVMENEESYVRAFQERLIHENEKLLEFSTLITRFCLNISIEVPVFLIANPDDRNFGGGYNGERLTLEIPREADPYPMFLHELMHAFLKPHQDLFREIIKEEKTLDLETLGEGIAYALSPGIYHVGGHCSDPLKDQVLDDDKKGKKLEDPYVRFRRFGLTLRPLLIEALHEDHQTIQTFLPNVVKMWRTIIMS